MKKSQNIKKGRAEIDPNQIKEYFDHLEKSLGTVNPVNIINYEQNKHQRWSRDS